MKKFDKEKALRKLGYRNNKQLKKISIIVSIIVLVGAIIYFSFARYESSASYSLISGTVTTSDIIIKNIFLGDTLSDSIPSKTGEWAFDHSECSNGANLTWNNSTWNITVDLTAKTECSLYFREKEFIRGNANNVLAMYSDYNTTTSVIDLGLNDKLAFDGTADNNLRYVGAEPLNYVLFNNELWRIIGVMNNIENSSGQSQSLFKIVRDESLGEYSWDSSESGINNGYGINQWGPSTYQNGTSYEGADLMRELNTDYLGNITVGTDGKWYNGYNNNKTADMPTSSLSNDAQNMMETVVWHLGSPNNNNGTYDSNFMYNITAYELYTRERANTTGKLCLSGNSCNDTVVRTSTWTGKVALIYASDIAFSASGEKENGREICLSSKINDWRYDTENQCYAHWFNYAVRSEGKYYYVLSPMSNSSYSNYKVVYFGNNAFSDTNASGSNHRRPTLYLKSSVSIVGGFGSIEAPYILG